MQETGLLENSQICHASVCTYSAVRSLSGSFELQFPPFASLIDNFSQIPEVKIKLKSYVSRSMTGVSNAGSPEMVDSYQRKLKSKHRRKSSKESPFTCSFLHSGSVSELSREMSKLMTTIAMRL